MPTIEELPMTGAQEKLLVIFDGSCDFCFPSVTPYCQRPGAQCSATQ